MNRISFQTTVIVLAMFFGMGGVAKLDAATFSLYEEFIVISKLKELSLLSGISNFGQSLSVVIESNPTLKTPSHRAQLEKAARNFLEREVNDTRIIDQALVKHLKESFSEQEIEILVTFFRSPVGQKYLNMGQDISNNAMLAGSTWAADKLRKFSGANDSTNPQIPSAFP